MTKPKRFYARKFLNRPGYHSGGFLLFRVSPRVERKRAWVDIDFTLADCNRVVDLSFYIDAHDSKADRENNLYKARLLRDNVVKFVDALEQASEWLATKDEK